METSKCASLNSPNADPSPNTDNPTEGVWKSAACWHNCGGQCLTKVLVKDGEIIRVKFDDYYPEDPNYRQYKGCLRGLSIQQQVLGEDRLKYPMKRKHWEPGGGNKELRGKDEWVRISWDEALDAVAGEIKRIRDTYGNESIWLSDYYGVMGEMHRFFCSIGGCIRDWRTWSHGAYYTAGVYTGVQMGYNDRYDIQNCELIVLLGKNFAWSQGGTGPNTWVDAKKAGVRFIIIDPRYTETARLLGAEWIPIRPGTDDALLIALMHTLLIKDNPETNPLIDWEVLNRCTIGFDADHMPAGADPRENFKDYLLGTYDGLPKSAEWAAEICGIPAERILQLAQEIGCTKKVGLLSAFAPARINNGESFVHAYGTLGYMTGHVGRSGRFTGVLTTSNGESAGPVLVSAGKHKLPYVPNKVDMLLNAGEAADAILNGSFLELNEKHIHKQILGPLAKQKESKRRDVNIQMVYCEQQTFNGFPGINKSVEALRKVEFVVSNSYALTTNALYADIVLPVTTQWERVGQIVSGKKRDQILFWDQVIEPMYEAKSDQWIAIELIKRYGIDHKIAYPFDEKQQLFNKYSGCMVIKEDSTEMEPLITITQEDIDEWGVEGKPQQGRITLREARERGSYHVQHVKGDPRTSFILLQDFVENPEAHPLDTESGKFEIYCRSMHEASKQAWSLVSPIPTYRPKTNGFEATFKNWETREKGDYPFQVVSPHYPRRAHSVLDNVPWLREAWPNPIYINRSDAVRLGIEDGDTVMVSNGHGKLLRPAHVTETMMPGVISLPHGPWLDLDDKGIDRAGCDNTITEHVSTGFGTEGYNTNVVNVEKWPGEPLAPDHQWKQRVVF